VEVCLEISECHGLESCVTGGLYGAFHRLNCHSPKLSLGKPHQLIPTTPHCQQGCKDRLQQVIFDAGDQGLSHLKKKGWCYLTA
jgi:hypothetical protein